MDIIQLLRLYANDQLPNDIKVAYVPIKKTAYGDIQIITEYLYPQKPPNVPLPPGATKETVVLEKYFIGGDIFFAGFGPKTKSLIIGKLTSTPP